MVKLGTLGVVKNNHVHSYSLYFLMISWYLMVINLGPPAATKRTSNSLSRLPGGGQIRLALEDSQLAMALWMWNGKRISRMVPLQ
jgi:hypothetical protein